MLKNLYSNLLCLLLLLSTFGILTAQEELSSLEKLTLASIDWEPFYSETIEKNGFYTALAKEVYRRAGYEIEVVFLPWKSAFEMTKAGKFDGLLGAYLNNYRSRIFLYSDVVIANEDVFVKRLNRQLVYETVEDLKPFKFIALEGSAQSVALSDLDLTLLEERKYKEVFRAVAEGRADMALVGKKYFNYYMSSLDSEMSTDLDYIEKSFSEKYLYTAITRKRADGIGIIKSFNTALEGMRADGSYENILAEFAQN